VVSAFCPESSGHPAAIQVHQSGLTAVTRKVHRPEKKGYHQAHGADAGGGKICKQALKTHPMAGKHRELMKQCKAEYRAYKKARAARYSKRV
jgi:hypothetical protein